MSKTLNILVIRFSSIGDIVLTTPIIRCLRNQLNSEVDYLTKSNFTDLVKDNPYIRNIYLIDKIHNSYKQELGSNKYDVIIDLQNNLRSFQIRNNLKTNSYVLNKQTIKRWLLIYSGINLLNNHIVDRYFHTIKSLGISNDNQGVDFFITKSCKLDFEIPVEYITWSISAAHSNKRLPYKKITKVISLLKIPILLIGGEVENKDARLIMKDVNSDHVVNLCGKTTIEQSAYLISKSRVFLTNDTGMMHIGSAFNVPMITFWGCTKPSLGFYPYRNKGETINIVSSKSAKPCSKHGRYCRFSSEICIKEIESADIYNSIIRLLK